MDPLRDGDTVAIIGGGPGGVSCAVTLAREAARRGMALDIVLFEGKHFGSHFNQCAGVLSPPITTLLTELFDIELPESLVQQRIQGYVLHGEHDEIELHSADFEAPPADGQTDEASLSLALRRVEFDSYMMDHARRCGVRIIESRVTDLEFHDDEVMVYSWSGTSRAKAVVGAFGLSRAMSLTLGKRTGYAAPPHLETVVSKIHPTGTAPLPELVGDNIHVFLPGFANVEFAALIPKGNHVTIIVAGESVTSREVERILALAPVRDLFGGIPCPESIDYFKGTFPVGLAHAPFGDRYVTVGDSAGLVRPFKGKGINSAIVTGHLAALTMLRYGVSRAAFAMYWQDCREFVRDIWYGRLVRTAANLMSHRRSLDPVVALARDDPAFRCALYDCVSGHDTYRNIVLRAENIGIGVKLLAKLVRK